MPKSLSGKVLIIALTAVLATIAGLFLFRWQGRQRSLNLRTDTADIAEIRFRAGDTVFRIFRLDEIWLLAHPAYAQPVEADEPAVESLLDDLRHWEARTLATAEDLETVFGAASTPVAGRLRVYAQGRWGWLSGGRKVWDRRYLRTDSALYLRDSRRLYSRLYDPRRAGDGGEAALAADFTAEARHWRNKWISHYYYYDIARATWQSADGRRFVYTPPVQPSQRQPLQTAALSAFRSVRFDRYAEAADSAALAVAMSAPPAARFSVVSTRGDSTHLSAYTLYDTAGQADWFRLCGILEKFPACATGSRDTVFLSYQPLDRLRAALSTIGTGQTAI